MSEQAPEIEQRPARLHGVTYRQITPLGTAFVTINADEEQPFEVFVNVGKAGSDTAAVAEAIGRLISLTLRLPCPTPPADRLKLVAQQLRGIGGGLALGFGPNRVMSLPDGIAQVLEQHLGSREDQAENGQETNRQTSQTADVPGRVQTAPAQEDEKAEV
jgi:ribonucleoside-diphosphate reductase alpha chain